MFTAANPITVALVNDYEIIVQGLSSMLSAFSERVQVVEMRVGTEPKRHCDVALFDTFAGRRHAVDRARDMVREGHVQHVLLYTWDAPPAFLALAAEAGVSGVALKSQEGAALVDIIERVAHGERIGLEHVRRGRHTRAPDALSTREQEVLALIALGMSNAEIASELFLSVDTVKTYVRRLYQKLGAKNRAQAALHAAGHSVLPPPARQPPTTGRIGTMSHEATDSVVLDREYDGTTSTLRAARDDVVRYVRTRTTDPDLEDRVALVVSELATNAIQASPGNAYAVRVSLPADGAVVMTVTSSSELTVPPPRDTWGPVTAIAPSGRGLMIVDRLTDAVDVERTVDGKIVITATFIASSVD